MRGLAEELGTIFPVSALWRQKLLANPENTPIAKLNALVLDRLSGFSATTINREDLRSVASRDRLRVMAWGAGRGWAYNEFSRWVLSRDFVQQADLIFLTDVDVVCLFVCSGI